ncbi:beta-ketoacyl-ACP synthase III [Microbacterium sp.]|uniref:beta-ketoacyl-ACP synthase III n=1 Tax=Microbacterium sp. TaxID=51671 RepID=UPI003A86A2B7
MSTLSPARRGSAISGLGHALPHRIVTNAELEAKLDTDDTWIVARTGIAERRILDGEVLLDLAITAASRALRRAELTAAQIDLIVVATMTAPDRCPSLAARLGAALGVSAPAVFDLNAACAGFSHALAVADHAITCGAAGHALVVGADAMSDVLDWSDRTTAILMADGAGAVVVSATDRPGIAPVVWGSDPALADLITISAPDHRFRQQGPSVFRWAITRAQHVARAALERAGTTAADLVGFVPHQANLRIITAVADQLGIPHERTAREVAVLGNASAATIPLALSRLVERGEIAAGPVLLLGFGGGFSYSGQVVQLRAASAA